MADSFFDFDTIKCDHLDGVIIGNIGLAGEFPDLMIECFIYKVHPPPRNIFM